MSDYVLPTIILGALAVFLIWEGTGIKKIVAPQSYWQRQVDKLEQDVENRQLALSSWRIQTLIQMEELPAMIEQYYDSLVIAGWDSTEAQKEASFLKEAALTILRNGLEISNKLFLEDSIALEEAKHKLQRLED